MALFNHVLREVNAKIVYFGPDCSGKESSITHIYRNLAPDFRSSIKSLKLPDNRMLFYDYCPQGDLVDGYVVRFHLYTIIDEVLAPSIWKKALKGVDGVVFVADSDPLRHQENLDRLHELQGLLAADGSGTDQIPFVIQYNRRDLPEAVALDELQRSLNRDNVPGFPTVANTGDGVQAPLSCLTRMILATIRETLEYTRAEAEKEEELRKILEYTRAEVEKEEELREAEAEQLHEEKELAVTDEYESEPLPVNEAEEEVTTENGEEAEPPSASDFVVDDESREEVEVEVERANELEPAYDLEIAEASELAVEEELSPPQELSLELSGNGQLEEGTLTIPVRVTSGSLQREYRLVISLAGVEPR
jgi:mutual gliding-motility protein MglA